jgi:L-arabinose isomerase
MAKLSRSFDGLEVWLLTGSQTLYGEETLRQVAAQSQTIASALDEAPEIPVRVVWKPVLIDPGSIRKTIIEANDAGNVIGVITWMHTFSPAKMWIAGLKALRKPLLHFHTQINSALPYSEIDFDFMNLNQAAHGDREFGYIAARLGIPQTIVVGHVSDAKVRTRIATWTRAAAGWHALQGLKVARFGDNMRYVAVTEGDKVEAETKFGFEVNTYPVNELADSVAAATDAQVDSLIDEYEDAYEIVPELRRGGDRHQSLRDGAAIEVGLRTFLEEGGFDAFTDTFEDLGALKQLPGLAAQRLMADGYGFGPEGDWKTSAFLRAASVMGAGLPGGASLMEDYTYDLANTPKLILGAHMLEVSPTISTAKPRLEIHPLGIGGREDPVRLVFTADPGPAIVVSIMDFISRFRLLANVVDVVRPQSDLPKLPVGRAFWAPRPNFATATTAWLTAGGSHHTVFSSAVGLDAFSDLAKMAGVELLAIDEATTLRDFEREIRANDAYYRA